MLPSEEEPPLKLESMSATSPPRSEPCAVITASVHARDLLSSHPPWWEGRWILDQSQLTTQLSEVTRDSKDHNLRDLSQISASLAHAFSLQIHTQHAELSVDGNTIKLASAPLPQERGVKLVGAERELFLWCEGDHIYWITESQQRLQVRRAP